jgi:signal transduction histidine kinase
MIKSLYLRLVATFLSVVLISLTIASFLSGFFYSNPFYNRLQEAMLETGSQVTQLQKAIDPQDLDSFMDQMSKLKNDFGFLLYNGQGEFVRYYADSKGTNTIQLPVIPTSEVTNVLSGIIFKSVVQFSFHDNKNFVVGIPVTFKGQKYALFIVPNFDRFKDLRGIVNIVLLIVLLSGSLLILIASRYIVNPLKKLTEATKRLARGDFNVNFTMKQKDELGVLADSFNYMARELKQLEQMRQTFISNVSHEIQTPLTSIRGFSKVMRKPELSENDRMRYLDIIEMESERLSRLSENLLKLASLESEHHPFHPSTISLDEHLRLVVVACEPLWSEKQLNLELSLPKTMLVGDEDQLQQVWMNILHNSIKFTPAGGTIHLEILHGMNTVEVMIKDNGIGISKEERDRIFERFYKVDSSRHAEAGGSGLGLAIVRKIIDIHHGRIEVSSEAGKGTQITVMLPSTQ